MDQQYITRREYDEHNLRMEDEHNRINKRLLACEKNTETQTNLLLSVERLANNMQSMLKEQEKQGKSLEKQDLRLAKLEDAPAEQYKSMKQTAINTAVGAVAGALIVGLVWLAAGFIV